MPSPFPGMDPYLEGPLMWEDFHARLATEMSDRLTPHLRPRHVAVLVPRVAFDELLIAEKPRIAKPDVGVYATKSKGRVGAPTLDVVTAPVVAAVTVEEPVREQGIEIRDVGSGSLVTAIEILSPVNKRPGHEAFELYHRKRRDLLRSDAHLLEIDLLRSGRRPPAVLSPLPPSPYFVFLGRAGSRGTVEMWPMSWRDPLPIIPVPLKEPDPDVPLDLGACLAAIYDKAAYDLRIDYGQPPPPPEIIPEDAAWLAERAASSKRPEGLAGR